MALLTLVNSCALAFGRVKMNCGSHQMDLIGNDQTQDFLQFSTDLINSTQVDCKRNNSSKFEFTANPKKIHDSDLEIKTAEIMSNESVGCVENRNSKNRTCSNEKIPDIINSESLNNDLYIRNNRDYYSNHTKERIYSPPDGLDSNLQPDSILHINNSLGRNNPREQSSSTNHSLRRNASRQSSSSDNSVTTSQIRLALEQMREIQSKFQNDDEDISSTLDINSPKVTTKDNDIEIIGAKLKAREMFKMTWEESPLATITIEESENYTPGNLTEDIMEEEQTLLQIGRQLRHIADDFAQSYQANTLPVNQDESTTSQISIYLPRFAANFLVSAFSAVICLKISRHTK